PNDQRWLNYIARSTAGYRKDRYGSPGLFLDLQHYVARLSKHEVVMHQVQQVRTSLDQLSKPDIALFLRSVWWHYRLRRYDHTLTVEIRPFARRKDEGFSQLWQLVAGAINRRTDF